MLKSWISYAMISNVLHVLASVRQQRAERKLVYTILKKKKSVALER